MSGDLRLPIHVPRRMFSSVVLTVELVAGEYLPVSVCQHFSATFKRLLTFILHAKHVLTIRPCVVILNKQINNLNILSLVTKAVLFNLVCALTALKARPSVKMKINQSINRDYFNVRSKEDK